MDTQNPTSNPPIPAELFAAVKAGNLAIVERCVRQQPKWVHEVIPGCPYGETLLHYAAYNGHDRLTAFLIEMKAEVNATGTYSGSTPLHSAAAGGHLGIVALLICLGADVNRRANSGWTALHCCCLRGYEHVAWFLERAGLSMQTPNDEGATPFQLLQQYRKAQTKNVNPHQRGHNAPLHNYNDLLDSSGRLSIQIASDVHVEFYDAHEAIPDNIIVPSAPILALLGDIGCPMLPNYREFLLKQASRFKLVLVIAGNHEFYSPSATGPHPTVDDMKAAMRSICDSHPNLMFLDKNSLEIGNYTILGCTLWSEIPVDRQKQMSNFLNDFYKIFATRDTLLTTAIREQWYREDVDWIRQELAKRSSSAKDQKIIVLTHHAPSFKVDGGGVGWSSHLDHLFKAHGSKVEAWAYGHTHRCHDTFYDGTRVVSNQCGYRGQESPSYRPDFVITL